MSDEPFLSRWSRLKKAKGEPPSAPVAPTPAAQSAGAPAVPSASPAEATAPLPPVESLTPESDFTPFMRAGVDRAVKGRALKTLFSDPRFNVMDGLDVYIADYSIPDPLPPEWLGQMTQMARLGDYHEPEAEKVAQAPVAENETIAAPPSAEAVDAEGAEAAVPASEEPQPPAPQPQEGDQSEARD